VTLPETGWLRKALCDGPNHLWPARAELFQAMLPTASRRAHRGGAPVESTSLLAQAFSRNLPFTVHPGIGYDIITTIQCSTGSDWARRWPGFPVVRPRGRGLDGGVVLSVGSAIMAPQVFEKSLSVVNNLRRQAGRLWCGITRFTSSIFRKADGGTGQKASRPSKTRLITCVLQKLRAHGRSDALRAVP